MSLSGIRTKIDTALSTISGLGHAARVPSVMNAPFAFPSLRPQNPVDFDFTAQNGTLVYHFYVDVLVNKGATLEQAQDDLDPYLQNTGSSSIRAALETISWGTDAQTHRLTGVSNYVPAVYNGTEFLGARLNLDVWV